MARLSFRRRRFTRLLRDLRVGAGLTQLSAAEPLRFSEAKMSRIEHGQLPSFHELQAMLDLYGLTVTEWAPVIEQWEQAKQPGWWREYGLDDRDYVSMEHDAWQIRDLQTGYVPSLLQTEEYIHALIDASVSHGARESDANQVAIRLRRQERLLAKEPLIFHAIIDGGVLTRPIRRPDIRIGQLRRILDRAILPNVTIQVIEEQGLHDGLSGPFTLLSFPEHDDQDLVYLDHVAGPVHLEETGKVAGCRLAFEHLASIALSPEQSIVMIEQVVADLGAAAPVYVPARSG